MFDRKQIVIYLILGAISMISSQVEKERYPIKDYAICILILFYILELYHYG